LKPLPFATPRGLNCTHNLLQFDLYLLFPPCLKNRQAPQKGKYLLSNRLKSSAATELMHPANIKEKNGFRSALALHFELPRAVEYRQSGLRH
jgi:hypothetical protein